MQLPPERAAPSVEAHFVTDLEPFLQPHGAPLGAPAAPAVAAGGEQETGGGERRWRRRRSCPRPGRCPLPSRRLPTRTVVPPRIPLAGRPPPSGAPSRRCHPPLQDRGAPRLSEGGQYSRAIHECRAGMPVCSQFAVRRHDGDQRIDELQNAAPRSTELALKAAKLDFRPHAASKCHPCSPTPGPSLASTPASHTARAAKCRPLWGRRARRSRLLARCNLAPGQGPARGAPFGPFRPAQPTPSRWRSRASTVRSGWLVLPAAGGGGAAPAASYLLSSPLLLSPSAAAPCTSPSRPAGSASLRCSCSTYRSPRVDAPYFLGTLCPAGLPASYCDDFECTSSPSVEASVRQLAKDLTRANGKWTPIYASNVEYSVSGRRLGGGPARPAARRGGATHGRMCRGGVAWARLRAAPCGAWARRGLRT